tara:strand:- start:448 stop:975 length:528 start_codon:yes stop_codon:yes gene_type:complete
MKKIIIISPLIIILTISIFLLIFLLQDKDPNKPPSALLNQDMPEFNINSLFDQNKKLSNHNLLEKNILINFFASWCAPCKVEHPLFFEIKKEYPELFLLGVNFKDKSEDIAKYLNESGNPYDYIGVDAKGLLGLEFGVFGLPETFLVNKNGKIIYKHLGPLTKKIIEDEIYEKIK